MVKKAGTLVIVLLSVVLLKAQDTLLHYRVETGITAGTGDYVPLWLTANRNGLSGVESPNAYLRAGADYRKTFRRGWHVAAGLDLAGAVNQTSNFVVQQAYVDVGWRFLNLSIGSKEREPLGKIADLTSGGMVEGNNARPVPQVRAEIPEYLDVPGCKGWFAFKGYVAYGRFTDDRWQRDFASPYHQPYLDNILYHSKELMLRFGNKSVFPLEAEIGMLMSAQFGGEKYVFKNGQYVMDVDMPDGLKDYLKVFIPSSGGSDTPRGDQVNVYGNHVGSWNCALTYYLKDWKFRMYYEHLFDDHSQMFFEYGRWKDGHLGLEVTFPENRWIKTLLWEGLATKDQTGPILYDGYAGAFPEYQVSARDDYYNNYYYLSWQHWGMAMGNPLLYGPIYNKDGSLKFRSNRARAHHVAFSGQPSTEWGYRVMASFTRHWGTYDQPLDEIARQFNSLYEVTYTPQAIRGWTFSAALGWDQGDYLGNSVGGMITIKKEGIWIK